MAAQALGDGIRAAGAGFAAGVAIAGVLQVERDVAQAAVLPDEVQGVAVCPDVKQAGKRQLQRLPGFGVAMADGEDAAVQLQGFGAEEVARAAQGAPEGDEDDAACKDEVAEVVRPFHTVEAEGKVEVARGGKRGCECGEEAGDVTGEGEGHVGEGSKIRLSCRSGLVVS